MTNTRFLHAADIHLDSPLSQLRRLDESTATRLARASRRSLELVVTAALEHQCAAVIIAGDLFDAPVKDAGAGLWVESQFKRLTRAGIQVVLIRGNHDALSNARRVLDWSDGVREFASEAAETLVLEGAGLAIHGQSFGSRAQENDLAAGYPEPRMGLFNVGVLHTSLSGATQHDCYAPTSVPLLESKGYDYWALGHIHARSQRSLSRQCYIGFSGNTQGRHIREPGAKGCQLVTLCDGRLQAVDFIATDSLRWHEVSLEIDSAEHLRDIEDLLQDVVHPLVAAAEDRPLAMRLRLLGRSPLHAELTQFDTKDHLSNLLSTRLREFGDIWLESMAVATHPARAGDSDELDLPMKYLRQVADELREEHNLQIELAPILEELMKKARPELMEYDGHLLLQLTQDSALRELVESAENLLVARLHQEVAT